MSAAFYWVIPTTEEGQNRQYIWTKTRISDQWTRIISGGVMGGISHRGTENIEPLY